MFIFDQNQHFKDVKCGLCQESVISILKFGNATFCWKNRTENGKTSPNSLFEYALKGSKVHSKFKFWNFLPQYTASASMILCWGFIWGNAVDNVKRSSEGIRNYFSLTKKWIRANVRITVLRDHLFRCENFRVYLIN